MESYRDYFKKAAEKAGSQNKLGAALMTSGANITRIIMGCGSVNDETIVKVAEYLNEDPAKLLLLRNLERCPEKARPYWKEVLKRYARVAAIALCILPASLGFLAPSAEAATPPGGSQVIHYQTFLWDRFRRLILSLLPSVPSPVCISPRG